MNVFGVRCKTQECRFWLKIDDMGEDWVRLTCPECKQAHDYYFADKEIRNLVEEPARENRKANG
jgi:hypothetical protein